MTPSFMDLYTRFVGFTVCAAIAMNSARVLFDINYCKRMILKIYSYSGEDSLRVRVKRSRQAAAAAMLVSTYCAFRLFVFN
jgi:hypothetical protein